MKFRKFALFVLVCALVVPAYAAGPVKPGKWETTMEMEMPGMPMKMPPITVSHCITKEQAENPENAVPRNDRQKDCKISDMKVDGNTVSWKMTCEKSQTSGTGSITYSGDSYTGHMDMKMAGDREMHMKYSGKYLGACDEK
jgi:hypothetical protein